MKYISHEELKKELLKDPEFARAYVTPDPAVEIGWRVKRLRLDKGLSQAALAERLDTKQPSVARLENGSAGLPSLGFLKKVADALGVDLILPSFSGLAERGRKAAVYK